MLLVSFLTLSFSILAGDIPEALMEGDQKALFIGEIKAIQDTYCTLMPLTLMMGSIDEEVLQVQKLTAYYGTDEIPQQGDYIVAVLIDAQQVDPSWLFKVTSSDYETLKLVSERYNMVERYEGYINEGAYFEAQRKLDEVSGEAAQPTQEVQASNQPNNEVKSYQGILIGIGIIVIIGGLVVWFKRK